MSIWMRSSHPSSCCTIPNGAASPSSSDPAPTSAASSPPAPTRHWGSAFIPPCRPVPPTRNVRTRSSSALIWYSTRRCPQRRSRCSDTTHRTSRASRLTRRFWTSVELFIFIAGARRPRPINTTRPGAGPSRPRKCSGMHCGRRSARSAGSPARSASRRTGFSRRSDRSSTSRTALR